MDRRLSGWRGAAVGVALAFVGPGPAAWAQRSGPFFVSVQVAGGTGAVAVGGGYWLANRRLEPELLVGLLPGRLAGGRSLPIVSLKATYAPKGFGLGHSDWRVSPLTAGGLVSYTFGPNLYLSSRKTGRYPTKNYYWWSSALRLHAFVGPRVVQTAAGGWPRRRILGAEIGTTDLYLVSWLTNHTLRLPEILTLGFTAKAGGTPAYGPMPGPGNTAP
ncbi:hypothetical protein LJ737_25990 [Hymenobacter sp. 15J16-1T3B]|uniref:hypothetical protein n=1 Tax=Hymenobacter sp. 15J16-1T3B TaxID=2886941 RepID=UPI001D10FEF8|nr:hypothetical protein [Hymenobacter sp. 15J16-1T3B]MCC3160714.1 hypothetical protein [Hymenobacter sp. 15J16-1T3B]